MQIRSQVVKFYKQQIFVCQSSCQTTTFDHDLPLKPVLWIYSLHQFKVYFSSVEPVLFLWHLFQLLVNSGMPSDYSTTTYHKLYHFTQQPIISTLILQVTIRNIDKQLEHKLARLHQTTVSHDLIEWNREMTRVKAKHQIGMVNIQQNTAVSTNCIEHLERLFREAKENPTEQEGKPGQA